MPLSCRTMKITKTEQITTDHGGQFDGYVFMPEETPNGSGILLLQEIYGVGEYIKAVAERLTKLGYIVMAPDMFWRIERGVALGHSEEDLSLALEYAQKFEWDKGVGDCLTALEHLRAMPEVTDKTGVMGFCFGGSLAFLAAAEGDPDVCVSYYGSIVPGSLERSSDVTCPLLLHFGGSDPYIERSEVAKVEEVAARRDNVEIHVQEDAGHAFDNHAAEMFHNPKAAEHAWKVTKGFLRKYL